MTPWALTAFLVSIVSLGSASAASKPMPQNSARSSACAIPQEKQFEFWVGQWNLTWPGEKPGEVQHGTNTIRRVLDGCVIQESFEGGASMHLRGTSVSTFDQRTGKWKQTWVDNEGGYLDFVGQFENGQMVLSREATAADGKTFLQRMVWKNITADALDWSWEASQDGGKTWLVRWPIHYSRR
ncbi:MAG TPA: DUF1579 family protein [Terriglobales bacterium]|nr:DUF1579 family protein [Terriglobales bacterium]